MPARLINPAPPRVAEVPAAHSDAPPRPVSEDTGQRSSAIIPGDDPGDQQPPKSTPFAIETHMTTTTAAVK
jgi:hypothetical protein